MKELGVDESWQQREIKSEPLTKNEVEAMAEMAGSFEAIFSRRSMKYRAWNLKEKSLSETDYKNYILKEYTFLKRPVIIIADDIFVGNSTKNVEAVKSRIA